MYPKHLFSRALWGMILLAGAGLMEAQPAIAQAVKVRVAGTDSALRCHQEIIAKFAEQGGTEVEYSGGGTLRGITLLCEGKADVAVIGVNLEERHKKLLAEAFPDPDKQPQEMLFSQTALIFVVNRSNTRSRITLEQLKSIYLGYGSGDTTFNY